MAKYNVSVSLDAYYKAVEASSKEEAIELAISWFQECEPEVEVEVEIDDEEEEN